MSGEARLRSERPIWADKIIVDPAIGAEDREGFWIDIESCPDSDVIECFRKCCIPRQMVGRPVINLDSGETLGTVQSIESIATELATQGLATSGPPIIPSPMRGRAKLVLERVLDQPDQAKALDDFHGEFKDHTIRKTTYPNARVFAFRSDSPPSCPANDDSPLNIHARLALPDSNPEDCLLLAFAPENPSLAKRPSCFEAGVYPPSMDLFQPQAGEARTAPAAGLRGLREVVITPPKCGHVTFPPRRIK